MFKILTLTALTFALAAPTMAAEMTKGGKSYQKRSNINQTAVSEAPQNPEDVANIAPAAGEQTPLEEQKSAISTQGKTLRDDLRLPRKN